MERIIINEIDNTSNVESLSSYDVAYVPGFALGPNGSVNSSLYRNPTLVTNRYEFVNMFGGDVPTFGTLQHYPTKFDEVAKTIDGSAEISYYQTRVNEFTTVDDIIASDYYDKIDETPRSIAENVRQYYVASKAQDAVNYTLQAVGTGETAIRALTTQVFGKTYFTIPTEGVTTITSLVGKSITDTTIYYTYTADDGYRRKSISDLYQEHTGAITDTTYELDENGTFKLTEDETRQDGKTYYELKVNSFCTIEPVQFSGNTFDTNVDYYEGLLGNYLLKPSSELSPVGPTSVNFAFYSTTNPSESLYRENGQEYVPYTSTDDGGSFIDPNKSYFIRTAEGELLMFAEGDADTGYRYALTLLSMGMPVYFEQMNQSSDDINVETMYNGLTKRFATDPDEPDYSFDSIGDYSIKFITSGGYPTFEYNNNSIAIAMEEMASNRADAIALIDHTDNPSRDITAYSNSNSVINVVRSGLALSQPAFGTYGAMFTPWYHCSHAAVTGENAEIPNTTMPGSLAYLTALAVQLQNYNPWLAVSGVTRGAVPYCAGLHTNKPLTNNIADTYQVLPGESTFTGAAVCINPITYIRNYGYCIWGNRTLHNNSTSGTKASSFLNLRSAVSDIKKRLFEVSQRLLFEQNTDLLWLNFQSLVTPLLETMVSDYILSDYAITRLLVDPNTGAAVPAYEVMAIIRIQPVNSVEIFNLTIVLENSDTLTITTSEE